MTTHRTHRHPAGARAPSGSAIALALVIPLLIPLLLLAACDGDPTSPDTPTAPTAPAEVDDYVADLGSWEDFAPLMEAAEEPVGEEAVREETVEEMVGGALQNVTYVCTETPYSLTDTPREIVMYEPNASIMWVGNLIQGSSYAGGAGTFAELSIRQRDTLRISINLLTGANSAVVPRPSLTTVNSAVGALIQGASDAGHVPGSSTHYDEVISYSAEEAALKLGISGKYMGVEAKARLEASRSANERTMTAHFVQKMFTIAIELPQSPGDMFSDELTQGIWQQQIDAGNIGPTNLPVYIASITYGRTLTYTLTSTHSESRMRAAISASYNGLAGGGSGYTEVELQQTLSEQNLRVTAIGGEGSDVLSLISSGNLKDYFREQPDLTTAKPLSYQLNFLGDNSTAKVSETTAYTRRECTPKPASGGRFEFLPLQESAAPVATPYHVLKGDFNGDGRDDLVWYHTVSGTAQVAVGFGQADATFDIQPSWAHPATPVEGWGNGYQLVVADVDGDGLDDLVWNRRQNGEAINAIYVAFSNGDGTFRAQARLEHPAQNWANGWRLHVGDMDGDGLDDLVWTLVNDSGHYVHIALSRGDGTFTFAPRQSTLGAGWPPYVARLGDVNGNGRDDIVWNSTGIARNRIYVSRSNGDGTVTLQDYDEFSEIGFSNYTGYAGDFNRDGRMDLLWINIAARPDIPIHRALGGADSRFLHLGWVGVPHPHPADHTALHTLIGDFNGNGGDDLLWNVRGVGLNHLYLGLSNVDAEFDFTPLDQEHPASASGEDWTAFAGGVLVLDVNGDGMDDVVWNERAGTNRIYVARAKPVGLN
jgi:hypothetical protein